jgi:hypothetical protein
VAYLRQIEIETPPSAENNFTREPDPTFVSILLVSNTSLYPFLIYQQVDLTATETPPREETYDI